MRHPEGTEHVTPDRHPRPDRVGAFLRLARIDHDARDAGKSAAVVPLDDLESVLKFPDDQQLAHLLKMRGVHWCPNSS